MYLNWFDPIPRRVERRNFILTGLYYQVIILCYQIRYICKHKAYFGYLSFQSCFLAWARYFARGGLHCLTRPAKPISRVVTGLNGAGHKSQPRHFLFNSGKLVLGLLVKRIPFTSFTPQTQLQFLSLLKLYAQSDKSIRVQLDD